MSKSKMKGAALTQAMPSEPKHDDPINNYEVKGHMQTLVDAHDIMNDKDKMAKVHKLAGRHVKALAGLSAPKPFKAKNLQELKSFQQKKFGAKGSAPQDPDMDGE